MLKKLKQIATTLRKPPSRDDILCAVSGVFDGATVTASVDSWVLNIETDPPRMITLSKGWLKSYVEEKRSTKVELEQYFQRAVHEPHWVELPNSNVLAFLAT